MQFARCDDRLPVPSSQSDCNQRTPRQPNFFSQRRIRLTPDMIGVRIIDFIRRCHERHCEALVRNGPPMRSSLPSQPPLRRPVRLKLPLESARRAQCRGKCDLSLLIVSLRLSNSPATTADTADIPIRRMSDITLYTSVPIWH